MRNLYSIYDKVASEYSGPFTAKNDKVATRYYVDTLKKANNPNDYELVALGSFDPETGIINSIQPFFIALDMTDPEANE